MGVIAVGMASLVLTQQKQIRALFQKQDVLELRTIIMRQMSNPSNCTWQLKDQLISISPSPTSANPSSTLIRFGANTLFWGQNNLFVPIAVEGQFIPNTNNRVRVLQIAYKNIFPISPGSNEYNGSIEVSFDPQSTAYNLHPLQISQTVVTTAVNSSTVKIVGCGTSAAAADGIGAKAFYSPGGTFTPTVSGIHKVTIVGGGGGAGGTVLYFANLTANTDYPVVVGAGGFGAIAGTSASGGVGGIGGIGAGGAGTTSGVYGSGGGGAAGQNGPGGSGSPGVVIIEWNQ